MTDEPNDELEQRLRRDLGGIADAVPVSERSAGSANVVPLTADSGGGHRRSALAAAGVLAAAAALLIGVLIWQGDDDPAETVATQDPTTVPEASESSPDPTAPEPTVPPGSTPAVEGCPSLPELAGATVSGETLEVPAVDVAPSGLDFFGADQGGTESLAVSETFQVQAALSVRPVIDFVGERVAREGPILLWWADGWAEAWVSAEGCETLGLAVTGGSRDQNALAAAELAGLVANDPGLDLTEPPATDCPDPRAEPGNRPALFFYCPFDDVDQIPRAVAPRDPNLFLSTPAQALQALFSTDPPPGWGTGIPLVMRGADVDVKTTDGVAQLTVDYDFEATPINGFSTSAMALAYLNQLQSTLFQFPEIQAIDLDTLCCGEWGGLATRADWESWLAQATQP